MRTRRRHVLHVTVLAAVVVQLSFASAFLVDAAETNRTYDALAAHHVALTGRMDGCASVATLRGLGTRFCRVGYHYHDQQFTAVIAARQPTTLYIDPTDTSLRMNKSSFDKGPEETDGDLVLAAPPPPAPSWLPWCTWPTSVDDTPEGSDEQGAA